MGIYSKKLPIGLPSIGQKKGMLIAAIVIIAIILGAVAALNALSNPLSAEFSPALWDQAKHHSIMLNVTIYNPLNETIQTAAVSVVPKDAESLLVYPAEESVSNLASGEWRKLSFNVRKLVPEKKLLEGSYTLTISLNFSNGKSYSKEAVFQAK